MIDLRFLKDPSYRFRELVIFVDVEKAEDLDQEILSGYFSALRCSFRC
jgi:hypothetical protein